MMWSDQRRWGGRTRGLLGGDRLSAAGGDRASARLPWPDPRFRMAVESGAGRAVGFADSRGGSGTHAAQGLRRRGGADRWWASCSRWDSPARRSAGTRRVRARSRARPGSRGEARELMGRYQQPRLADLEARVAALEGAPIREGAPAPEAWSDADVAALRAGLETVKVAERRDREAQRLRNVVAHIIPDAEPAVRERAVALLQETIEAGPRREPERSDALRGELLRKLEETVPRGRSRVASRGSSPEANRARSRASHALPLHRRRRLLVAATRDVAHRHRPARHAAVRGDGTPPQLRPRGRPAGRRHSRVGCTTTPTSTRPSRARPACTAARPDAPLDLRAADWVSRIAAAQRPDGYLNTWHQTHADATPFEDVRSRHELYCAGHLLEAGLARHDATGRRTAAGGRAPLREARSATRFGPRDGGSRPGTPSSSWPCSACTPPRGMPTPWHSRAASWRRAETRTVARRTASTRRTTCRSASSARPSGHAVRALYLWSAVADLVAATGR